ncbi:DNA cytosine methyltransferase [Clostridium sp.]|uniref:DNA cytosine methyltransferase n=1 Tax=Clostridium sp. TaxID=1506 RepID=UPI0025C5A9CC|nr:DNA cytosine methyltransferase [Clostridium sp.]
MTIKNKLKVASFFAGVGGIDLGFEQTGIFNTIYANEKDLYAVKTFETNFNIKVDHRDINDVKEQEIPDFDVMLAGFPCQAFSLAGYRQGFNDEKGRGTLFFELIRIIKVKKPKIIFLENVKNLVGHDNGNTFRTILENLENLNYYVKYQILNAKDYGNIPHGRERIYIVAFRHKKIYQKFEFPKPIKLTTTLNDCIDFEKEQDKKYYYTAETCKFYDKLLDGINKENTIYQWRRQYVRENKSNVCPTLTANMGTGGHNVPLIKYNGHIRKLTPRETFNLQGFPKTYILPTYISNTQLYKQAGNSVVVSVIYRIANELKKILI